MNNKNIEAVYPLSPMQQGMIFHSVYAPESGAYIEQLMCALHGDLNVAAFERAWKHVVARHSVLRTAFVWKRLDKMFQVVHREVNLKLDQSDWRDLSASEQETELEIFLRADRRRGFDLTHAPLLRLALIRLADNAWRFVWTWHHALADGWSLPILLKEMLTSYAAFRRDQSPMLEPVRPYRDYIAWLQNRDAAQAESFWRRTLQGFTAPTPLTVDHPASNTDATFSEIETRLTAKATSELQNLARQNQLTLNTLVQGAWALLLNRYSGEEDVMFGATVSGRPANLPGAETMVGLFINTLPVRVRAPSNTTLLAWLDNLQARQIETRQYEYAPLAEIQNWSALPHGTPLFESILIFENYPVGDFLRDSSLQIGDVRSIEQTNYPITAVAGLDHELVLKISYDNRRFDHATINRMLGHWRTLLENFIAHAQRSPTDLPLLTDGERKQLLEWNATQTTLPERCIHELFQAQVERTPDAIAVMCGDESLTYRELNRRANQLAHHLQKLGVQPDSLV
ncbi:MAG: AMP-binding protein, partial [Chloroflexi bacterium]|nr:AMP-binding protein [Chloroflexota bacterium]